MTDPPPPALPVPLAPPGAAPAASPGPADPVRAPDKATLGLATLFAAFLAAVVLVLAVLPAEFGIDPTNFGRITGIDRLDGDGGALDLGDAAGSIHRSESAAPRNDTLTLELTGLGDVEYKLPLLANQTLLYSWSATGPVDFEFHGDPDRPSRPGEYASYDIGQGLRGDGGFQAPFDGKHGWYFRNVGDQPVTVTLRTWGHYGDAAPAG